MQYKCIDSVHFVYTSRADPENGVFCTHQPCARDPGNKVAASAHGMGLGGLTVDAVAIGCLGAARRSAVGNDFFVLEHFGVCVFYY